MNEDKATRYHRLKRRVEVLSTLATGGVLLTLLLSGAAVALRERAAGLAMMVAPGLEEAFTVVVLTLLILGLLQGFELPLAFYQGHVLEHRYGLSNQSARQWFIDYLKGGLLAAVFGVAGASLVYWALRTSPAWWWVVSGVAFAVVLVGLVQLAPVVLLPLFYTFKPLDRPALVERLTALAARARTHIAGVYEWALSPHTKKANAALAGMGRTRRILLSDTLLAGYSDDEIEVVLAHELSHHVHHDLWRAVALQTLLLFVAFFVIDLALGTFARPLGLRGMDDPAGLPLLLLLGGACSVAFMPLANALSRAHERRADRFALDTTRLPGPFVSAMKRLAQQNMAEDAPSRFVQWLFYSHPPIRERIAAARRWEQRDGAEHRRSPSGAGR